MDAPTTYPGTAVLTVVYLVASVGICFGVVFFVRLILAPATLYWTERGKTETSSKFTIIKDSATAVARWLDRTDGTNTGLYQNTFYLPVGNWMHDGKTLRRVQMRIFILGEPELCTVRETSATEIDLRHGEVAYFQIGWVVSEHAFGISEGSTSVSDDQLRFYEHNIPRGHMKFSTSKHNLANGMHGEDHTWRIMAVISADDTHAKQVVLNVTVGKLKSRVENDGI